MLTRPGVVRAAPTLPATPESGCPQLHRPCCDRSGGEGLSPPLKSSAPRGARGSRYRPTTSRTLSMNCGSLLILNVSTRCGLSPNAFQIRPTVDFDNPVSAAIEV